MSPETKQILINRVKSFAWRMGMMVAVALVAFVGDNMSLFNMPMWMIPVVSLALSEVTKWLNTQQK